MRPDDLRRLLRQRPFQQFRVHLTDGTTYEVRQPDMAIVTPSTMAVGVPAAEQAPDAAEHIELIALLHIVRVEPVSASAAPAS